jgi:threonine aldolase
MQGYLADNLWLETARAANARCAQLAAGIRGHNRLTFQCDPQANIIFFDMPRSEHKRMLDGGAFYYVTNGDPDAGDPDEMLTGRLVTDWSVTEDAVQQFIDLLHG